MPGFFACSIPFASKISALVRNIGAIAARWNPIGGRVALGEFEGDEDRIASGPFDGLALVVRVAPASPDVSESDQIAACNDALLAIVFDDAVERGFIAKCQGTI